jgi:hypothetical protein
LNIGRRQLRREELGETLLRRRKPTKACSARYDDDDDDDDDDVLNFNSYLT